jgi:hypothetical protein
LLFVDIIYSFRSGLGVVDVAGGKGELSFELINLSNVPCTVIDPRYSSSS